MSRRAASSHALVALLASGLVTAVAATPTLAQGSGRAIIGAPTVTSYQITSGDATRMISQTTMPIVVLLPFSPRFGMDLSTSFATSGVSVGGVTTSRISGLTDTQLRGNLTIGENLLVTLGLNLPTGQYLIPADQQEAAGQIGNDFLNYAVSSMGSGLAVTGGLAYARPLGDWNLGVGGSVRRSTEFAAFEVEDTEYRFTPADEMRVRIGVDRPIGDGQLDLSLSYSTFGDDIADSTSVSTGDRITLASGLALPVRGVDVFVSAWNLFRLAGEQVGGPAPRENVFNLTTGVSVNWGSTLLQPNIETRLWTSEGVRAGNLVSVGVRARIGFGALAVYPSMGVSTGTLFDLTDGSESSLSGFRGSLTVRWN